MMKKTILLSLLFCAACSQSNTNKSGVVLDSQKAAILGGDRVTATQAESLSTVALIYLDKSAQIHVSCSGTLISKNLVLTAAHCLDTLEHHDVKVFFGDTLPSSMDDSHAIQIAEAVSHSGYRSQIFPEKQTLVVFNDIALVKLAAEVPEGFAPVPVLAPEASFVAGTQVTLAGFGWVDEDKSTQPLGLMKTRVTVSEVRDQWLVTDQRNGNGACNGDSGGPAYLETAQGLVVVGATRGPETGYFDCHHYGQYTFAAQFKDFLLKQADMLEAEAPQFVVPK